MPSFIKDAKGGSEIQAYLAAQELLRRGWEVYYIRENNQYYGKVKKIDGIFVYSLHKRHTKLKWLNSRSLFRVMDDIRADYWYCRGTVSYIYPVWRNSSKVGGKILWACSSDRFLSKRIIRELNKESLLRRIASRIDRSLFQKCIREIDLIILQNNEQKRLLKKNFGLDGKIIYNICPTIPVIDKKREPLVLWVGRLKYNKHPEIFIEVVKGLKEKPYRFLAVGRDAEGLGFAEKYSEIEKHVPTFNYMGELEKREVFRLFERAKLLVNTSDYEGFPSTFIEAWMHGVPVVSLNVDPDKMIQKNGLGKVSGNMIQFVRDIEQLMEDQKLWDEISHRCRRFAEENFDVKKNVNMLEKMIKGLK